MKHKTACVCRVVTRPRIWSGEVLMSHVSVKRSHKYSTILLQTCELKSYRRRGREERPTESQKANRDERLEAPANADFFHAHRPLPGRHLCRALGLAVDLAYAKQFFRLKSLGWDVRTAHEKESTVASDRESSKPF